MTPVQTRDDRLPDETWRLSTRAGRDQQDAWRDAIDQTHLTWRFGSTPVADARPTAHAIRRRRLGDVSLVDCRCGPCSGERTRREVRTEGVEAIGVLAVLAGREVVEQDGRQVELRAGDVALWDSRRPVTFAVLEPLRKRTLLVPLHLVSDRVPAAETSTAWTTTVLPRGTLARELTLHLLEALASPGALSAPSPELDVSASVDVVASAVTTAMAGPAPRDQPESAHSGRREALLAAVHATVEAHVEAAARLAAPIQPRELTPSALARQHAISLRALHQLTDGGDGIAAWVRRRRLEGARRHLAEGAFASVAGTAAHWGFADAAHFSRAYLACFGERPRDTRRAAGHS